MSPSEQARAAQLLREWVLLMQRKGDAISSEERTLLKQSAEFISFGGDTPDAADPPWPAGHESHGRRRG